MGARQSKADHEEHTLVQDSHNDYGSIDLKTRRTSSTSSCDSLSTSSSTEDITVAYRNTKSQDGALVQKLAEERRRARRSMRDDAGVKQEGSINFRGITRETKAQFMVLSDATRGKDAWLEMEKKWELKPPSLILSVIGGARPFYLDDRIASSFRATILKASQLPNACIITGGAYSGVMKMVGDALQETMSAFSLGISTWTDVMNLRDVLMKDEMTEEAQYVVGSYLSQRGLYLDYQHTNFIIVEEKGKEENREEKGQCRFRASLEQYMSKKGHSVLLVVNGGFGTLDFLHRYVKKVACPVVVIQKSGKAADVLAFGYKRWDEIKAAKDQGKRHEGLFNRMKSYMLEKEITKSGKKEDEQAESNDTVADGESTNVEGVDESSTKVNDGDNLKWLDRYYTKLVDCLEEHHLFTLAEVGAVDDIDTAILNALLSKQGTETTFEKLKLALWLKRADFARSEILRTEPQVDDENLRDLMLMALARGDHEYVRLLMDYGVNMHEILTFEKLQFLYGYQACEDNFVLEKALKECCWKLKLGEGIIERNKNADDEAKFLPANVVQKILNDVLCDSFMANDVLIFDTLPDDSLAPEDYKLRDPFWELFIWAVMCNIPMMADFLWPFGRNQMAKALIASEIFRVMSNMEGKFMQATAYLSQVAVFYQQAAHELLDELSATSEVDTNKICTTMLPRVPTMTCLDIAVKTKQYEYVAHNSIQMILADVWTGKISTRKVKAIDYIKVFFSIIFPFLMAREAEEDSNEDVSKQRSGAKQNCIYYAKEFHQFYFHTPILTFILHFFGTFLFLVLYTYLVMTNTITVKKGPWEIVLIAYVFSHVIDEIYQVTQYDTGSILTKCMSWISDQQNQFDLFNIIVFFVAWGLSFDASTLAYSHTVHSINCGMWILRFSTILRVVPTIGVYLEMISEMLRQLMWFLLILGATILSYGISSTAILHPGHKGAVVYIKMFLRSWFTIYGEYFLEIIPDDDQTTHLTSPRLNSYDEYVVWMLLGVFLFITQILLLNIIIAAFNSTYSRIETRATHISKYRFYDLVVEYSKRVSTPPPLSLIHHIFLFLRWLLWKLTCNELNLTRNTVTKLHKFRNPQEEERLRDTEYICAVRVSKGNTKGTEVLDYLKQDEDEENKEEEELVVEKNIGEVLEILKDGGGVTIKEESVERLASKVEQRVSEAKEEESDAAKTTGQQMVERVEAMEQRMCRLIERMEEKISLLSQKLEGAGDSTP